MDKAYKLLEGTEKFCDPSRGLSGFFSSNPNRNLSPHEKLYRRSIVADCLLFESIIVFLKQGFTSYVKGGYILRKAWKMYERIYAEAEQLCTLPSPVIASAASSMDPHIGRSFYDKEEEVGNGEMPDGITGGLPIFYSGINMPEGMEEEEEEEGERDDNLFVPEAREPSPSPQQDTPGTDEVDARGDNRPDSRCSGNESLPDLPNSSIQALEHEDSRLRGAIFFGYGLMNIIVSLIPPKLMKLANLLGFHGTRKVGLQALEFASHSQDMKAPLARSVSGCWICDGMCEVFSPLPLLPPSLPPSLFPLQDGLAVVPHHHQTVLCPGWGTGGCRYGGWLHSPSSSSSSSSSFSSSFSNSSFPSFF